uniref:Uncharacterized protein n=1 Tax=Siphoviridae sp. ctf8W5 TaxID=2825595 RepID=A0A8S5Q909_9CAUD|nr:MAG TPA: hypothetical protein [Siphoviridae sp. ctf8W5]
MKNVPARFEAFTKTYRRCIMQITRTKAPVLIKKIKNRR